MIRLELAEKSFAGATAPVLREVTIELQPGQFQALLGPSGSGKTTLLRILAGLDTAFTGSLRSDGAMPRTAFLFQEPRLMPWMTALENVALVSPGQHERAMEALAVVGLQAQAGHYPRQLSGGMQRRVALARCIVHDPDVLLLDEPFVSLDEPVTRRLHDLLCDYWQRRSPAVLLVSHNLDEAIALADHLIFLGGNPARVMHRLSIDASRPRSMGSPELIALREALLRRYPDLLAGRVDAAPANASETDVQLP